MLSQFSVKVLYDIHMLVNSKYFKNCVNLISAMDRKLKFSAQDSDLAHFLSRTKVSDKKLSLVEEFLENYSIRTIPE